MPAPIRPLTATACATVADVDASSDRQSLAPPEASSDPDLSLIYERWARLPDAVRAGIVAMVRASDPEM
jgi:hypothetical protein